ncbi:MAG TPA: hypothetical protein O0X47_07945 [Methanocorpusculum sp.]|nr:hypothetical protein [Methanocorpusculum sp.]
MIRIQQMKILKKLLAAVLIFGMIISSAVSVGAMPTVYPSITADPGDTSTKVVEIDFPFKGETVSAEIILGLAPYYGAKHEGSKSTPLFGCSPEKYYAAVAQDPAQDEMYAKLLGFFTWYAESHGLTGDEYVELLTTYVQNIPYKTVGAEVNFPIETVIEDQGDCDDKSILLAGLLARSGYAAGVVVLSEENHMTAAVKTKEGESGRSKNQISEYILIETTRFAYIGEDSALIRNRNKNRTRVREEGVILVGGGAAAYSASWQIDTILEERGQIVSAIEALGQEMRILQNEIADQKTLLGQSYDQELYEEYEKNLTSYYECTATCYAYIDTLSVINTGSFSREETYQMVISMM